MKFFEFSDLIESMDIMDYDLEPYKISYLRSVADTLRELAEELDEAIEELEDEEDIEGDEYD